MVTTRTWAESNGIITGNTNKVDEWETWASATRLKCVGEVIPSRAALVVDTLVDRTR